jgi:hypothetical protein
MAHNLSPRSVRGELVEPRIRHAAPSRPSTSSGRTVLGLAAAFVALISSPALAQRAETPEQRLDALDQRITRLEDMNQVEKVQRAYGYFVDKGQWTQLSELFADDATLEIGGRGVFVGKKRVLEYMHGAFGPDGPKEGLLANHMQFQPIVDISPDGKTAWVRSRAFVMSVGGWGLPLYEDEFVKQNGVWKFSRESGPFTMYTRWKGWGHDALNNTWPDKFDPPPDLPPSTVYLTYPAYWIVPFHYPNPVTGKPFPVEPVGAYQAPPGTPEQEASLKVGRLADGTQPIAQPPKD